MPTFVDVNGTVIGIGSWRGVIEADPETARTSLTFILPTTEVTGPLAAGFLLQCRKGELHGFIDTQQSLNPGYADGMTVRFGMESPQSQQWFAEGDSTTLIVSGEQKRLRAFVRKLANYTRLTIQVGLHQVPPRTLTFDLRGIEVVSVQLLAACK